MAKNMIRKKDGSPSPYFWSDKERDNARRTVYKQTQDGVKRMRGCYFDAERKTIRKD